MFKNKKVLLVVLLLLSLIVPNKAFASNNKTQLQVVEKSSETKYLEDDQGYITKTIVDSNPDTGEVTVELRLNNKGKEQEQNKTYENTEIYILVSENLAKDNEKLTKYINDIGNLASKIFSINTKTKIGIIGIKGTIRDWTINDDGKAIFGDKDEGKINGTAENAEIISK